MGISLEGTWKVILTDGTAAQMHLPGTLDESGRSESMAPGCGAG